MYFFVFFKDQHSTTAQNHLCRKQDFCKKKKILHFKGSTSNQHPLHSSFTKLATIVLDVTKATSRDLIAFVEDASNDDPRGEYAMAICLSDIHRSFKGNLVSYI